MGDNSSAWNAFSARASEGTSARVVGREGVGSGDKEGVGDDQTPGTHYIRDSVCQRCTCALRKLERHTRRTDARVWKGLALGRGVGVGAAVHEGGT